LIENVSRSDETAKHSRMNRQNRVHMAGSEFERTAAFRPFFASAQ